jgi:nitroimidazol reductase NimA-like FMN-containing flavoprotein (pyridoxamine 5'-phosphate oxidase superfamily)
MRFGRLKETDSLAILRKGSLGRLACVASGWPYVVPVNYVFDGKDIFIHSLPGKKIDALRDDPRVCFQVDEIIDTYHWRSVIVYGSFEEISDEQTRDAALNNLHSHLPHMTPVETRLVTDLKDTIVFRIKVNEVTGMGEDW